MVLDGFRVIGRQHHRHTRCLGILRGHAVSPKLGAVGVVERIVLGVYLAVLQVDYGVANSLEADIGVAPPSVTSTDKGFFAPVSFLDVILRPSAESPYVWCETFIL